MRARALTHPQRDEARFTLGATYDTCGQARFAAGDLPAAEAVLTAAVGVYHELAAEHPAFMEADQRLAGSLQHLGEVYRALDLPEQHRRRKRRRLNPADAHSLGSHRRLEVEGPCTCIEFPHAQ
ncbi:hypothetical protein [Nonomuraea sp. NPDC050786]|uniref:hypothetical protein n=1 Tax=Nonomuraea sp. NPDC050786 TaxID=3154840 RepID=UPI0034093716